MFQVVPLFFQYMRSMGLLSSELILHFSTTPLLRVVNVVAYYEALATYLNQLQQTNGQLLAENQISLGKKQLNTTPKKRMMILVEVSKSEIKMGESFFVIGDLNAAIEHFGVEARNFEQRLADVDETE